MKKRLLLICLLVTWLLKISAQSGYVLSLPGGSTGANSNMAIPSLSTLITDYPFTIEMWVNPGAITAYDGFFYDKGASKTSLQFANATTGEMRFDLFGQSNVVPLSSAKKLTVGKWQHLAVTVYKDSAVVEIDGSFYAAAHTKAFGTFGTATPAFGWDKDVADRAFGGYMDEIRIWNTAKSRSEILSGKSTALSGGETNLVAYYNFNDNNANDKTSSALHGTVTGGSLVDLAATSTLSAVSVSGGVLIPAFSPGVTTYNINAPADVQNVTITGYSLSTSATITNNSATINAANPSVTLTCTAGTSSTGYTFNFVPLTIDDWDANGATGANTYPNQWGWSCGNFSPWNSANSGSGVRYIDNPANYTYNGNPWTGRIMYVRWDGSPNLTGIYSIPVRLEACKTYSFLCKYAWNSNGSGTSTFTFGINKSADNTGESVSSKTYSVTDANRLKLYDASFPFSPKTSGVYYLTIKNDKGILGAIADLSITEYSGQLLSASPSVISLSDADKSAELTVIGNALTSDVTVTVPAGVSLSRTTIPASETPCGGKVTITWDYSQDIAGGDITITSGTNSATIPFTFTKPSISVNDKNVEIENNGKSYPVYVSSTTADSVYISSAEGFSLVKSRYSAQDFKSGNGKIKVQVNSNANLGSSGKLIFSAKRSGVLSKLDSVNMKVVAASKRYLIKHNNSNMMIGDHSTGLYPALTTPAGSPKQKFFMRRVNINPASTTDTFNLVQDDDYRVIRKMTTNGWDTEFGEPSANAKFTRQEQSSGAFTITNTVTNKVLGVDATTADARLYANKDYGGNKNYEWLFIEFATVDSTLASLTLSTGTLNPAFISTTKTYSATLPSGTTSVTPTAVPSVTGATVTGTEAVNVSSGTGVSTIVVTALDGKSKMTYTVNYTVAKSTVATLSDLKVSGTTVTGFAAATETYNIELPVGTTAVPAVTATTTDSKATAVVTAATALPGATNVVVTAEDGTTKKTYTINFTVAKSTVATLSDLKVSGTTVSGFAAATITYNVELPAGTTAVPVVTATVTDSKATAVVTAATVLPGTTNVVVTAEDGTTKKTYTINFTVAKSTVATLSDLKVSGTTISGFSANTITYNVVLPFGTTAVPVVTATTTDPKATAAVTATTALPGATTIVVTAEDGTTKKTYTINFTVNPVGINDISSSSVGVYPTVSDGTFTVKTGHKPVTITVYDMNGKVVLKKVAVSATEISVENAGMYFIRLEADGISPQIVKVVKTK